VGILVFGSVGNLNFFPCPPTLPSLCNGPNPTGKPKLTTHLVVLSDRVGVCLPAEFSQASFSSVLLSVGNSLAICSSVLGSVGNPLAICSSVLVSVSNPLAICSSVLLSVSNPLAVCSSVLLSLFYRQAQAAGYSTRTPAT